MTVSYWVSERQMLLRSLYFPECQINVLTENICINKIKIIASKKKKKN